MCFHIHICMHYMYVKVVCRSWCDKCIYFQLYSQVLTSELVLYNSGKVDMDFTTFGISNEVDLAPGGISVQPPTVCQYHIQNIFASHPFLYPRVTSLPWTIWHLPSIFYLVCPRYLEKFFRYIYLHIIAYFLHMHRYKSIFLLLVPHSDPSSSSSAWYHYSGRWGSVPLHWVWSTQQTDGTQLYWIW